MAFGACAETVPVPGPDSLSGDVSVNFPKALFSIHSHLRSMDGPERSEIRACRSLTNWIFRVRSAAHARQLRSAPWAKVNFNHRRSTIVYDQAVPTSHDSDQCIGAVKPRFVQVAGLVQIVVHSVTTMYGHDSYIVICHESGAFGTQPGVTKLLFLMQESEVERLITGELHP